MLLWTPPLSQTGPWNVCSAACGYGLRNRTVTCEMSSIGGGVSVVPLSNCVGAGQLMPPLLSPCVSADQCPALCNTTAGCYGNR